MKIKSFILSTLIIFIASVAWSANVTIGNLVADATPGLTDLIEIEQSDASASNKATIGNVLAAAADLDASGEVANDSHTHGSGSLAGIDISLDTNLAVGGGGIALTDDTLSLDADLVTYAGITPSANVQSLMAAADYAAMLVLLNLEAGIDFYDIASADAAFQPLDADLTSIAALGSAANKMAYTTALATWAETALTAFGRSIIDDADEATFKATVNLEIGTDVQAWSAVLDTVTASTYAGDNAIVTVGTIGTGVWQGTAINGTYIDISGTTAEAATEDADLILIYDNSAALVRSQTKGNFKTGIGAGSPVKFDIGDGNHR
ncbi:MAG: hypothetical protein ACYSW6_11430 [Planctomycetota bacterium]|jgi:hypothetical protein